MAVDRKETGIQPSPEWTDFTWGLPTPWRASVRGMAHLIQTECCRIGLTITLSKGDNKDMAQLKLTTDILEAAAIGFEVQMTQIDEKISEIKRLLNGSPLATAPTETVKPRKKRSAAVRRRMALAQRARYAKLKKGSEPTQAVAARPKKRKMSAAGRRAISLAAKKRWADIKAAKKAA